MYVPTASRIEFLSPSPLPLSAAACLARLCDVESGAAPLSLPLEPLYGTSSEVPSRAGALQRRVASSRAQPGM